MEIPEVCAARGCRWTWIVESVGGGLTELIRLIHHERPGEEYSISFPVLGTGMVDSLAVWWTFRAEIILKFRDLLVSAIHPED